MENLLYKNYPKTVPGIILVPKYFVTRSQSVQIPE